MSVKTIHDADGKTITLMELDGHYLCPPFQAETLRNVATFKARPDDVIMCTYAKAGTHWIQEICRFLLAGTTDLPVIKDSPGFLEKVPADSMDALPSPRTLMTHFRFEYLSPDILAKRVKLVYVTRDPRDVAVSFFHHHTKLPFYGYAEGEWKNYFPLHLAGQIDYGNWFTYTKGWEQGIRDNPDLPVFATSYEALQKDALGEVRKVAAFLERNYDDDFLKEVVEKSSFESMRGAKVKEDSLRQAVFYRKGKSGDWKNTFTVAQSEIFNAAFEEEMRGTDAYQLYSHTLNK